MPRTRTMTLVPAVTVLSLLLASCSTTSDSFVEEPAASSADPSHALFARDLEDQKIDVSAEIDDVGVFADTICEALDNRKSPAQVANALAGPNITRDDADTVVRYAILDVCPKYTDLLP